MVRITPVLTNHDFEARVSRVATAVGDLATIEEKDHHGYTMLQVKVFLHSITKTEWQYVECQRKNFIESGISSHIFTRLALICLSYGMHLFKEWRWNDALDEFKMGRRILAPVVSSVISGHKKPCVIGEQALYLQKKILTYLKYVSQELPTICNSTEEEEFIEELRLLSSWKPSKINQLILQVQKKLIALTLIKHH